MLKFKLFPYNMKANQVLVRVCATSINPIDYQTRRGDYKELVRLPAILGVDFRVKLRQKL